MVEDCALSVEASLDGRPILIEPLDQAGGVTGAFRLPLHTAASVRMADVSPPVAASGSAGLPAYHEPGRPTRHATAIAATSLGELLNIRGPALEHEESRHGSGSGPLSIAEAFLSGPICQMVGASQVGEL